MLALVRDELQRNVAELCQIQSSLESGKVNAATPSLNVWDAISTEILSSIPRPDIAGSYYQLERVARLLALYRKESESGPYGIRRAVAESLPELKTLVERTNRDCQALIANLDEKTT